MAILLSAIAGLLFGLVSSSVNRLLGTVLSVAPVLVWFVFLVLAMVGGISDADGRALGFSISAIVVGLLIGQMAGRSVENQRSAT